MTTTTSFRTLHLDDLDLLGESFGDAAAKSAADEWSAAVQPQGAPIVRSQLALFARSTLFGAGQVYGLATYPKQHPMRAQLVSQLSSESVTDYFPRDVALYLADVSIWSDAALDMVVGIIDPDRSWVDMALELFPGSRNMTADEWTRFNAIVSKRNKPLAVKRQGLSDT